MKLFLEIQTPTRQKKTKKKKPPPQTTKKKTQKKKKKRNKTKQKTELFKMNEILMKFFYIQNRIII